MYCGGDDVGTVVIDVGTFSTKGGFAGEDTPKDVFPTDVGIVYTDKDGNYVGSQQQGIGENQDIDIDVKKTYYTGTNSITYKRVGMDIINPLQDGLIKDWEAIEHIWNHTFHERLLINPGDHPILLAEASFNSRSIREKVSEIMFEKYHVPALFISKNAVLSSFAQSKASSLVLDSGGGMTSVVPVHDGFVIKNGIVKSNLAGNRLTDEYYKILTNKNIIVNPINLIKKVEVKPGEFMVTPLNIPGLTESYKRYVTLETIRDLKETSCRVADSHNLSDEMNISQVPYELPDGNLLEVGSDRFQIPELLFNPTPLNIVASSNAMNIDSLEQNQPPIVEKYLPISKMVTDSIERCEIDIKKELFQNMIITGGNTMFQGFQERLIKDITESTSLSNNLKPKIVPNQTDRKTSVFVGGSILGSLGSFQQMWMSKSEWEEHGRSLVEKKCP